MHVLMKYFKERHKKKVNLSLFIVQEKRDRKIERKRVGEREKERKVKQVRVSKFLRVNKILA